MPGTVSLDQPVGPQDPEPILTFHVQQDDGSIVAVVMRGSQLRRPIEWEPVVVSGAFGRDGWLEAATIRSADQSHSISAGSGWLRRYGYSMAAVVWLVMLLTAAWLVEGHRYFEKATVPRVKGLKATVGEDRIEERGFDTTPVMQKSTRVPMFHIIRTRPAAGERHS